MFTWKTKWFPGDENSNCVHFCCFKGVFTSSFGEKGTLLILFATFLDAFFSGIHKVHSLCFVVLKDDNFKCLLGSSE